MAIYSCMNCKPPKRYPGCHDHCPDYLSQKAEYDKKKAVRDFERAIRSGLTEQRSKAVNKALLSRKVVNKGICNK